MSLIYLTKHGWMGFVLVWIARDNYHLAAINLLEACVVVERVMADQRFFDGPLPDNNNCILCV